MQTLNIQEVGYKQSPIFQLFKSRETSRAFKHHVQGAHFPALGHNTTRVLCMLDKHSASEPHFHSDRFFKPVP